MHRALKVTLSGVGEDFSFSKDVQTALMLRTMALYLVMLFLFAIILLQPLMSGVMVGSDPVARNDTAALVKLLNKWQRVRLRPG